MHLFELAFLTNSWGFIVNGVCTIFVALLAYFTIPGFPDRPNPLAKWYLTDKDFEIARRRTVRVKREPLKPINAKSFLKAFKYWQLWAIACECCTTGKMENTVANPLSYLGVRLQHRAVQLLQPVAQIAQASERRAALHGRAAQLPPRHRFLTPAGRDCRPLWPVRLARRPPPLAPHPLGHQPHL